MRLLCCSYWVERVGGGAAARPVGPALDAELAARGLEGGLGDAEGIGGGGQRAVAEVLESVERDGDGLGVLARLAAPEDVSLPHVYTVILSYSLSLGADWLSLPSFFFFKDALKLSTQILTCSEDKGLPLLDRRAATSSLPFLSSN